MGAESLVVHRYLTAAEGGFHGPILVRIKHQGSGTTHSCHGGWIFYSVLLCEGQNWDIADHIQYTQSP